VLEERTAVPTEQSTALGNNIPFNEGVPENFENNNGKQCLIILDDLIDDVYSEEVCNLFSNGSHQRNISVILFTQNLLHQGRFTKCKIFGIVEIR